jgi:hypothetical protein
MGAHAHILTRSHNEYDQHGEYFVAWFDSLPTTADIQRVIKADGYEISAQDADYIRWGGGRQGTEDVWWDLKLVKTSNLSR